jgi:L,D-peptidoglycan transpeptidase YkuD (ErfK/YbiS/YcfS/YnhG family)
MIVYRMVALLFLFLLAGCYHRLPVATVDQCLNILPSGTRQAVVVAAKEAGRPFSATMTLYERGGQGWQAVASPIAAVVGRNGIAPLGEKREGDGRTPSGIFPIERTFGYEPLETKLPYIVLTPEMIWIDEPRSPRYNTLADKAAGIGVSHEIMRRDDDLYRYGAVIEYNTKPVVPGAGSAIFFHIWRNGQTPTSGCVATEMSAMVRMLRWLDPAAQPVAVIGSACP